jgi:myosin heavy subunit
MADYLIDNFISEESIKQIERLSSAVNTLAETVSKAENLSKPAKTVNTAEFDAIEQAQKRLIKAEKELAIAKTEEIRLAYAKQAEVKKEIQDAKEQLGLIQRLVKAKKEKAVVTMEEKVATQAVLEQERLHAVSLSEKTSALKKMSAEMKMLSLDLQKLVVEGKQETAEYANKKLQLDQLNTKYKELRIASSATIEQREKEVKAIKEKKVYTQEEIVSMQSLNQVEKLNAIIKSQSTSEMQKMSARMKLLNLDLQKLVSANQTDTDQYRSKIAEMKRLNNEYNRMGQASGSLMQKTQSMYGATFSLTQVMRELPNFAISSRIGFMAISNNLPMLADNFSMLSNSIDETGKKLGAKGAFKVFAQSLLSMNTILIIASTLLILFGDDIVKAVGKLFKGKDAVDSFSDSLQAMIKVLDEQQGRIKSNIEGYYELGAMINRYKQYGDSAEATVKKWNETMGLQYGKLNDVNEVMKAYGQYAKEYIDWNIAMEASMLRIAEAAKTRSQIEGAKKNQQGLFPFLGISDSQAEATMSIIDKQLDAFEQRYFKLLEQQRGLGTMTDEKQIEELIRLGEKDKFDYGLGFDVQKQSDINRSIAETTDELKKQGVVVSKRQFDELMKERLLERALERRLAKQKETIYELYPEQRVFDDENGGGGTGGGGTGTTKDVVENEKQYSYELNRLRKEQLYESENMQAKSNTGEEQWFDKRTEASHRYLQNQEEINFIEKQMALDKLKEDRKNRLEEIREAIANNTKLLEQNKIKLSNGKITQSQYNTFLAEMGVSNEKNYKSITTVETNFVKEQAQTIDNYYRANIQSMQEHQKTIYALLEEEYQYKKSLVDNDLEREKLERQNQKNIDDFNAQRLTKLEEFLSVSTGYKRLSNISYLKLQQEQNETEYQAEVDGLNQKIAFRKLAGLEYTDLKVELDELGAKRMIKKADEAFELEKAQLQLQSDLRLEIEKNTIATIEAMWSGFHERYLAKLQKSKDDYAKIEKEALQDTEDKEKAGVITKEQSEKRKIELQAYYNSVQEQLDRDKEKAERRKFLFEQAMAIAKIWTNFAVNSSATGLDVISKGLLLGMAIAQTTLVAAQSIPYFAEGGIMDKDGVAVLGDGGKNELAISPSGKAFISNDKPTMYNLEKGTQIYPDANKIDIQSLLRMHGISSVKEVKDDKSVLNELKKTNNLLSKQKPPIFAGMPLIRQMQFGQNYAGRKRGLL